MTEKNKNYRVSFSYFFNTFLVVTFPLHIWGILMIFQDIEFMTERTNWWDATGYASYSLLFILLESILLSAVVWGSSLLLPKSWREKRTLSVAGTTFTILAAASITDLAFHAFSEARISRQYLHGLSTYPALTYVLISATVIISIAALLFLILKTESGEKIIAEIFDRIMLLGYLYIFLDIVGIVIVIIRNVSDKL